MAIFLKIKLSFKRQNHSLKKEGHTIGIGFFPGDIAQSFKVSIEYVHSVATGSKAHHVVGIFFVAHLGSLKTLESNFPAVLVENQLHGLIERAKMTSFLETAPPLVSEAIIVPK